MLTLQKQNIHSSTYRLKMSTSTAKSLKYCLIKISAKKSFHHLMSRLTWSQILCVSDQVLHRLHHLCHSQVFQDAFADTDYFADL